jgi:hypothetical protein
LGRERLRRWYRLSAASGAHTEAVDDVLAMMARGGAILWRQQIRIGVRDSLPSNIGLYRGLGYELVSIDPQPRGADKVWTMIKRV